MSRSVLNATNVHKSFKKTLVLCGVDLSLHRGSVMGLLGKNGAGKTTLIKCALGMLKTNAGNIEVLGEDAWKLSAPAKTRIGYVPQTFQGYRWFKVKHLIAYTAAFYPAWNEKLCESLLRSFEIDASVRVDKLSLGHKQSLAFILAICHAPDLLILDEPAASLDPEARRHFLSTVLHHVAHHEGSVLFSTHISSDIERVADSIAVLKSGKICYQGSLDRLKESIKRVHLHSSMPIPRRLSMPGILRQEISGLEAMLTVDMAEPALIAQLQNELNATITTQDLNIEDIFLELHHD